MVTLYEEIGGAAVVKTAVSVFYQRVLADPALAPWFAGVDLERLRAHQRAFLMVTLGGPDLFTGREIAHAHAGLRITGRAFDTLVSHLTTTLHDLGVAPAAVARVGRRLETMRADVVAGGAAGGTGGTGADLRPAPAAPRSTQPSR